MSNLYQKIASHPHLLILKQMLFYHLVILDINQYFVRISMLINITAGRHL